MKKIVYTRPSDGGVSLVIPASKSDIEKVKGPMTEEEYEAFVKERSIPHDAIKPRDIDDSDIPDDRGTRDAWVDVTAEERIDVDCSKARDIRLAHLRKMRNIRLAESDVEMTRALEDDDKVKIAELKVERKLLRDATEAIKALDVAGKYNDKELLDEMKLMSEIYG